nr:cylicin-2-like [Quercus suber]
MDSVFYAFMDVIDVVECVVNIPNVKLFKKKAKKFHENLSKFICENDNLIAKLNKSTKLVEKNKKLVEHSLEKIKERKKKQIRKGKESSNNEEQDVNNLKSREESKEKNIVIGERNDKRQRPQKNQEKISELEKRKQKQRNKGNNGGSKIALSSGGMKLEPRAFGGAFPVQVRLTVEKDCFSPSEAVLRRRRKKKQIWKGKESSNNEEQDVNNLKSREESKEKNIVIGERNDKRQRPQKNREKISELEKRKQKQRNKGNNGGSNNSIKSQKNKEKHDGRERNRNKEKKEEKLGGLIFMCNPKTKPDCFRYTIMGVSTSENDVALSSAGMKLEPRAFGGAFPVQVRLTVEKDCFSLSEAVLRRKLTELFQPAGVLSNAHSVHSPQVARVYDQTQEIHERGREVWPYSHNETLPRDPYSSGDFISYPLLSHERDQRIAHRDVTAIPRGEIPRDLYLTEREYQAYGLQGEKKFNSPIPIYACFRNVPERI